MNRGNCGTTNVVGPRQPRPLVLASASPRRAALLREAGYEFEILAAPIDEPQHLPSGLSPPARAEALAYFKARQVAAARPDATILAADTLVVLGDRCMGKPRDADDARRILAALSGSRHRVISGVAVIAAGGAGRTICHDVTELRMRRMSDREIDTYIAGGEWQGKAGAYAIQETGERFIEVVRGSTSNVVGLPLELLEHMWHARFAG